MAGSPALIITATSADKWIMETFLARQAIFDRRRTLDAYELLYRSNSLATEFDGCESSSATRQVIASTLLSIGLDKVVGGKKAFLNFDHRLLFEEVYLSLPRDAIVIEILESVEPTPDLIDLCGQIRQRGYSIALDDFVWSPSAAPLIDMADLIKVDVRTTSRPEQERLLRIGQAQGIAMLAEKVETHEEFEWAWKAGYDFFQGYFFARPVMVRGHQIPTLKTNCLRLLREVQSPDIDFKRLTALIREDVSLVHKLLRYANSALVARREKIESISRALVVLGEAEIRRWVTLAVLPSLATDKPAELLTLSIVRARFCEKLAQNLAASVQDKAFLMGMFSTIDALVDRPLDEALQEVNLDTDISRALLGTAPDRDPLACINLLTRCNEFGDWDQVERLAQYCGIPVEAVSDAYLEATLWAEQAMHSAGA